MEQFGLKILSGSLMKFSLLRTAPPFEVFSKFDKDNDFFNLNYFHEPKYSH